MVKRSHSFVILTLVFSLVFAVLWMDSRTSTNITKKPARRLASVGHSPDFEKARWQRTIRQVSPFEYQKVSFGFDNPTGQPQAFAKTQSTIQPTDTSEMTIPEGTELLALVDNSCLDEPDQRALMTKGSFSIRNEYNKAHDLAVQAYAFSLDSEKTISEITALAETDPCLIGLSKNGLVTAGSHFSDPETPSQRHLNSIGIFNEEDFFFESSIKPASSVKIAIVDSGVDYNHPDLRANMWRSAEGSHGRDFVNNDDKPMDDFFHGTHVAGLAAAVGGNGENGSGVMPTQVKIMAVKVLDSSGAGSYSNVANGLRWAVDNGADLINLSLSGPGENAAVQDALAYAVNNGVPVFISAGNDGIDLDKVGAFRTPTSYARNHNGVVSVGAIDAETSRRSGFSNFGPDHIELSAPGSGDIFSTLPEERFGSREGTSMSSPIAAGAAALIIATLKSANYPYTAAEIEDIITRGSRQNTNLMNSFSEGRQLDLVTIKEYLLKNIILSSNGGLDDEVSP